VIRQVVKQHLPRVMYCYEKARDAMSTRIVVDFTIDTKGRVSNASATGGSNRELQTCIAQEFAKMLFEPSPKATKVRYPLQFHSAGQ
jgi:outer membrane biosynthesis protein TonB